MQAAILGDKNFHRGRKKAKRKARQTNTHTRNKRDPHPPKPPRGHERGHERNRLGLTQVRMQTERSWRMR